MKKMIFCATVAYYCCGLSSSHAQTQFPVGAPTPAPKLVAAQSEPGSPLPFLSPSTTEIPRAEVGNPFDVLPPFEASSSDDFDSRQQSQPAPIVEDPNSLPVGRRHRRHNPIVDTMAEYGQVANVPHVTNSAVDWGYGHLQTPNPVATVLLHQQCVEGLWDNYSQQRAAECAQMWSRLTAKKRCHHCGSCGHSRCKSGCASGGKCSGNAVTNRYQSQPNTNCDSCSQCAVTAQPEAETQLASAEEKIQR
jgi:hypothetical protein